MLLSLDEARAVHRLFYPLQVSTATATTASATTASAEGAHGNPNIDRTSSIGRILTNT